MKNNKPWLMIMVGVIILAVALLSNATIRIQTLEIVESLFNLTLGVLSIIVIFFLPMISGIVISIAEQVLGMREKSLFLQVCNVSVWSAIIMVTHLLITPTLILSSFVIGFTSLIGMDRPVADGPAMGWGIYALFFHLIFYLFTRSISTVES